MRVLIVAALAAVMVASCGGSGVRQGTVTNLTFVPAHDSQGYAPIYSTFCSAAGSTVVCYPIIIGTVPVTEHHADDYEATLVRCMPGGCKSARFSVDRGLFGTLRIGTWFDRDNPDSPRNI